ncbi:MAG: CHC2 zinc finger domain-containing protein [Acidobacteriota bacterium]
MNFTDRLLQKTDVGTFYGQYTQLRKLPGKSECKGLCPLHEEKTPSFFVNIETGSFKCFGCGAGGGPVQFEAKRLRISDKEACKYLAKEFGLNSGRQKRKPKSRSDPTPDSRNPTPSAPQPPAASRPALRCTGFS